MKSIIFKFIIPVVVIYIAFRYGLLYGFTAVLAYIGYLLAANMSYIYMMKGSAAYSKKDTDEALKWYKKAYEYWNSSVKAKETYAYILLREGKIEESEKMFNALLKKDLKFDEKMTVKSNLALVLWKKGNLDEAINVMEEIFSKFKTTAVYGTLGYFYMLKGDLDKALKFNLVAYDYNNSDKVILDNLGQNYYLKGEYDKSEEIYEKLMKLEPTFPEPYYFYGRVLEEKGMKKEALETMKKSLNYKFSFLSTMGTKDIEAGIKKLEDSLGEKAQVQQEE